MKTELSVKTVSREIFVGIIIAAISIPIGMGYAQIAGLPAVYGLYGSVFPILLFALFSTSPQFVFGVDAAPAALVGSALLGMNIEEIKEPEEIDNKIQELKEQKYTTIIIPNELASFSEKIYNQYKNDPTLNIIITPTKNK